MAIKTNTGDGPLCGFTSLFYKGLLNKVVKPHNGPSAVLVLIAIGNHVVEDGTGFYGFGINGSLVSNWL